MSVEVVSDCISIRLHLAAAMDMQLTPIGD